MKGFTFIELLLVLGLITALITIFVYFINPVEILKKHRDIQRINDLKALEIAINTYLTANPNADLDGMFEGTGKGEVNQSIYISVPYDKDVISNATITDSEGNVWNIIQNSSSSNMRNIDGTGWVPINFTEMKYPPLSYLPIDPINSYALGYFYTYTFERKTKTFELNAKLEYKLFNKGETQDIVSKDGGSDNEIYETGSNKCVIIGNSLYGEISTTTCREERKLLLDSSLIDMGQVIKLESGKWLAYYSLTNEIATHVNTSVLHDNNLGTCIWLDVASSNLYLVHDLENIYYVKKIKYAGDAGSIGDYSEAQYWNLNNSTWTYATSYSLHFPPDEIKWVEGEINTSTFKWRVVGNLISSANICEMETYVIPIYWFKYFEKNTIFYDIKRSIEKDGYYYIAVGSKNNDFWVVKLSSDGNIKFATSFGETHIDVINSVEVEDVDNDGYSDYYILGGYTNSYGENTPTSSNGYLIKMTTSSDILNSQFYGTTSNDVIKEVKKSLDGYYFAIGNTVDPITTATNLWFLKIASSTLSLLSETKLGATKETIGNSFLLFNTSTALLVGRQLSNSYLANFDLVYNTTTYEKIYSTPTSSEEIVKIIEDRLVSNSILALIKIWDVTKQIYYFQVRRININDGSYQIIVNYVNYPLNEIPSDFLQNEDGSIIIVGYSRYGNLYPNLTIYKFDHSGKFVYKKEYNRAIAYAIEKAFDPGYIIAGYSYKTNSAWVIHVDEKGNCPGCFAEKRNIFEVLANIFKSILPLLKFLP